VHIEDASLRRKNQISLGSGTFGLVPHQNLMVEENMHVALKMYAFC
jgi:hypothetical protein